MKLTFAGYQKPFLDDDDTVLATTGENGSSEPYNLRLEDDDPTLRMVRPEPELDEDEAPTLTWERDRMS